jgi:leader peptidase (prepilin peptidase)/N-methyltransferase
VKTPSVVAPGAASVPYSRSTFIVGVGAALLALAATASGEVPLAAGVGVALLVPAAVVDVAVRRLPDRLVAIALLGVVVAAASGWIIEGAGGPAVAGPASVDGTVIDMVGGALVVSLPLLLIHLVSPSGMGFGDVKAGFVMGAAVGAVDWQLALSALVLAAGLTATYGIITRARTLPLGPGLVGGATIALVAAPLFLQRAGR